MDYSICSASASASAACSRRLGDGELMARIARSDDPLAFAILYQRHRPLAFRLASRICIRYALAEEVVQEAFLSLWRNRHRYDSARGPVGAWLMWLVRNRAIDVCRQNALSDTAYDAEALFATLSQAEQGIDFELTRREDARQVLAALDALPTEQSAVITLAYYGGYTQSEIASMLDTPIGTVKGRMRLGMRKMAQSLHAVA